MTETNFKIDWSVLRLSLVILLMSLVISGAMIWFSYYTQQQQQNQLTQQTRSLKDIQRQLSELDETLIIIEKHYDEQFNELVKQRFFSLNPENSVEEQRLTMEEQINSLLPPDKLPTGTYELLERQIYKIPMIENEPDFNVYKTIINLQLSLLHEGDILKLLQQIKAQTHLGLLNLQHCDIKQIQSINIRDVSSANFTANCSLAWYTAEIAKTEDQ